LRRPILSPIKEAIEEILHRIVLLVWLRATLLRLPAFHNLGGGNIHYRGFHAIDDRRKRISGGDGIRHRQRRCRCAAESKTFHG